MAGPVWSLNSRNAYNLKKMDLPFAYARNAVARYSQRTANGFPNIHPDLKIWWVGGLASLIVSCNRTESLDASHREIQDQAIILPKECEIVREFAKHLTNTAKKLEEDEKTGSKFYVYIKLGPDHFRHAFNYEAMARQNSPNLLFPEFSQ